MCSMFRYVGGRCSVRVKIGEAVLATISSSFRNPLGIRYQVCMCSVDCVCGVECSVCVTTELAIIFVPDKVPSLRRYLLQLERHFSSCAVQSFYTHRQ